jgi:hypothetical protein
VHWYPHTVIFPSAIPICFVNEDASKAICVAKRGRSERPIPSEQTPPPHPRATHIKGEGRSAALAFMLGAQQPISFSCDQRPPPGPEQIPYFSSSQALMVVGKVLLISCQVTS